MEAIICLVSKREFSLCYTVPGTVFILMPTVRRTSDYSYKNITSEAAPEYIALHISKICKA